MHSHHKSFQLVDTPFQTFILSSDSYVGERLKNIRATSFNSKDNTGIHNK